MQFFKKEILDFIAIVQQGNYTKAADYLGVKQSGLSKSIIRLESELNTQLFIRGPRLLKLTQAGEIIYQMALHSQTQWNQCIEDVQNIGKVISGKFELGIHNVLAKKLLPSFLKELNKQDAIEVDIILGPSRENIETVKKGQMDFAIVADPIAYPELQIKELWHEFVGVYARSTMEQKIITYNPQMIGVGELFKHFPQAKLQPIKDYDLIRAITTKDTNSMGVFPSTMVKKGHRLSLIKKIGRPIKIALVYRKDRSRSKAFKYVTDLIFKCMND